jgi:hypothetical protein
MFASPTLYFDMLETMRDDSLRPHSMVVAAVGAAPVPQKLVHEIFRAFGVQRINVCTLMCLQSTSVAFLYGLRNLQKNNTLLCVREIRESALAA